MSRPSISLATSAVLVMCMEKALSLSKTPTISPVSTAYLRSRSIERNRATVKMRRQYQAVFVDGPAKGRVQALAGPMSTVRFAEMPMLTVKLLNAGNEMLDLAEIVYGLRGHFAPCGRGQFYRE